MTTRKLQEFTELSQFELDPKSIRMLSLPFCSRNQVVLLGRFEPASQEPVHLGMLQPNEELVHALAVRWARPVVPVALNLYEINKALDVGFGTAEVRRGEAGYVLDLATKPASAESNATELVNDMLLQAVAQRASDLHLECYPDDVDVRLRIDGLLHQVLTHVSPENLSMVTNRLKIMSGLDIVEHRHPQDGRFRALVVDGEREHAVDFRVAVLPGPHGEDVVIRVLDTAFGLFRIDELGMSEQMEESFRAVLSNPEGTIVVTGPTGSGKTVTLYSALDSLNNDTNKILTAEDPIEHYLEKVNQKQTTSTLSMADLARAFLRQDPDVILIGEVRDEETAEVAMKAATTGHLVLTTLHTPDAIGAIPRLRSLALEDNEIADALLVVVSQRLARRICKHCGEEAEVTADQRRVLGPLAEGPAPRRGRGCEKCRGTGSLGRIGLFELLLVDEDLQDTIAGGASTSELRSILRRRGRPTLLDDALDKVRDGVIDLDELIRVIPYRQILAAREAES